MVEDREALELTESIEEAERLFIEDFDTWDMNGYYLYSKLWRSGVSRHIDTGGSQFGIRYGLPSLLSDIPNGVGGVVGLFQTASAYSTGDYLEASRAGGAGLGAIGGGEAGGSIGGLFGPLDVVTVPVGVGVGAIVGAFGGGYLGGALYSHGYHPLDQPSTPPSPPAFPF